MARIIAISRSLPKAYSQPWLRELLIRSCKSYSPLFARSSKITQIFDNSGIKTRHMAIDPEQSMLSLTCATKRIEYNYINSLKAARSLSIDAAEQALNKSGIDRGDIKHMITTSELPSCPPIDLGVYTHMGFKTTSREGLTGWGCAGGVGGLAAAYRYLSYQPTHAVLLNAVEIPSRIWSNQFPIGLRRLIEFDAMVGTGESNGSKMVSDKAVLNEIVVSALLGDAAISCVLVGKAHPKYHTTEGPVIVASRSRVFPDGRDLVGTVNSEVGTRMFLSSQIPKFVGQHVPAIIADILEGHNPKQKVDNWVIHPGGPKVLEAFQDKGYATRAQLQPSWDSLAEIGNCMSCSVLDTMSRHKLQTKDLTLVFGVGPGMVMETLLMR